MIIFLLTLLVIISGVIAIFGRQYNNIKLYSIFKPLTTIIIILIAVLIYKTYCVKYSLSIIFALIFSLVGDIFLINKKYFLQGLLSFLLAHIAYIFAITSLYGFATNLFPLIILFFIGGLYYIFLKKDLNKYAIPVFIYISVIIIMNWQAICLVINKENFGFLFVAMAALLFSISDAILAYNKFKKPFNSAEILILSTYWLSIYLFTIAGFFIFLFTNHDIVYSP